MKLVVGLGNIGQQYKNTRHNVGFNVIDLFAEKFNITVNKNKHKAIYGESILYGQKVIIAKPLTYMNLSGESVAEFMNFYKDLELHDILILCDDINLSVGNIKIKKKGSSGGQNGLKNIIRHLSTEEFPRLKIGVGSKPKDYNLADYVLSKFLDDELAEMKKSIATSVEAIDFFIKENSIDNAMNKFNIKNNANVLNIE